jgi:hypothetical protein
MRRAAIAVFFALSIFGSACGVGAEPEPTPAAEPADDTDSTSQALTSVISCYTSPLRYCNSIGYRYSIGGLSKCYWVGNSLVQTVTCSNGKLP